VLGSDFNIASRGVLNWKETIVNVQVDVEIRRRALRFRIRNGRQCYDDHQYARRFSHASKRPGKMRTGPSSASVRRPRLKPSCSQPGELPTGPGGFAPFRRPPAIFWSYSLGYARNEREIALIQQQFGPEFADDTPPSLRAAWLYTPGCGPRRGSHVCARCGAGAAALRRLPR
jgi:hypothetical protein